jgi:hypothetical protein
MNIALVSDTYIAHFSEPGESELEWPTPDEVKRIRDALEDHKRRLREISPVDWWHPIQPGHDDL